MLTTRFQRINSLVVFWSQFRYRNWTWPIKTLNYIGCTAERFTRQEVIHKICKKIPVNFRNKTPCADSWSSQILHRWGGSLLAIQTLCNTAVAQMIVQALSGSTRILLCRILLVCVCAVAVHHPITLLSDNLYHLRYINLNKKGVDIFLIFYVWFVLLFILLFYRGVLEYIQIGNMIIWHGSCMAQDMKALQQVIKIIPEWHQWSEMSAQRPKDTKETTPHHNPPRCSTGMKEQCNIFSLCFGKTFQSSPW